MLVSHLETLFLELEAPRLRRHVKRQSSNKMLSQLCKNMKICKNFHTELSQT